MHGQELLLEAEVVVKGRAQALLVDQRTQRRLVLADGLQPVLHLLGKAIDLAQAAGRGNAGLVAAQAVVLRAHRAPLGHARSEEHTSELPSPFKIVCPLFLLKKKKTNK